MCSSTLGKLLSGENTQNSRGSNVLRRILTRRFKSKQGMHALFSPFHTIVNSSDNIDHPSLQLLQFLALNMNTNAEYERWFIDVLKYLFGAVLISPSTTDPKLGNHSTLLYRMFAQIILSLFQKMIARISGTLRQ